MCAKRGLVVPATIADHVTPHNGNWQEFINGKLQSLCNDCHVGDKHYYDLHHVEREPRLTFGEDGWPSPGQGNAGAKTMNWQK
jgi:hypothetical protein